MSPQKLLLGIALGCAPAAFAGQADLLTPQQAFRLTAQLASRNEIVVRYDIAPGYYLYRDKLKFATEPAAVALGVPRTPKPGIHEDEFFGRVEIYRGPVEIRVPVKLPAGAERFTLIVRSQGCADAGVCYTPQQQQVVLGSGTGAAEPAGGGSLVDSLGGVRSEKTP
jgi:thiol:disulfide interchange protein DsbD